MAQYGAATAAAVVGLVVAGPLVNHVVLRWVGWRVVLPLLMWGSVPPRRSLGRARARCRRCGGHLAPGGLPALPGVVNGGRCRRCGERVAGRTMAVEVVTAVLFGVVGWRLGWSPALVPLLLLVTGLVAASVVDLACWRIPSRFVYVTTAAVGAGIVVASVAGGAPAAIGGAVVGGVVYFVLLGVLYLVSPRMLGLGDVRLAVPMGAAVGWMTWSAELPVADPLSGVLQAALLGSLTAMVPGIALLVVRRRSEPYPFGPWLSLGALATVLLAAPGPV